MYDGNINAVNLDPHFQKFIANQIKAGHYSSVTDAVHLGLRLLENYETKRNILRQALKDGEESDVVSYSIQDILNQLDDDVS